MAEAAFTEKGRRIVHSDIDRFKSIVANADVVMVGKDGDYIPESPRLREQMRENGIDVDAKLDDE